MSTSIEKVSGIGPATAALLQGHGIHSAEDLATQRVGDLAAIKGFNAIRAGQVIDAAKQQLIDVAVSDTPAPVVEVDKKDKEKKEKSSKSKKKKPSKKKKKSSKKDKEKTEGSKKKSAKKK